MLGRDITPIDNVTRIEAYVDGLATEAGLPLVTMEWMPDVRAIHPHLFPKGDYLLRLCIEERCTNVELTDEELALERGENAMPKVREAFEGLRIH